MNPANFGHVRGRLVRNPKVLDNKDGSHKVLLTVAARRDFPNKQTGQYESDYIELEQFIPASRQGLGVYPYLGTADMVDATYSLRSSAYKDKNGNDVYSMAAVIDKIDIVSSREESEANRAKHGDNGIAKPTAANGVPVASVANALANADNAPQEAVETVAEVDIDDDGAPQFEMSPF